MKKISKNFLIICGIFLLMGIVGVSAIYISNVSLVNSFKTLTYKVDVLEEFYNDWGTKKIKIVNSEETNADVVLRVTFNESFTKNNDILSNEINGEEVVEKEYANDFLTHFSKDQDGWYYYDKILKAKDSVEILNSINLKEDLIRTSEDYEKYKTYHYELGFQYETIQATEKAIKDIWGKDSKIIDGEIEYN